MTLKLGLLVYFKCCLVILEMYR